MNCTNCGNTLGEKARFCGACGTPVSMPNQQQPVGPPPIQRQPVGPPQMQPVPSQPIRQTVGPPIKQTENLSKQTSFANLSAQPLPPVQMVTPADAGPEKLFAHICAEFVGKEGDEDEDELYINMLITNKKIVLLESEEDQLIPLGALETVMETEGAIVFPTREIHSISHDKLLWSYTVDLCFYNGKKLAVEIKGKIFNKQFMPAMESAIPGITFVQKTTLASDYYLNISDQDPRNPFGTRYNPNYPRSYVVAQPLKLNKDPHGIDEAINDAKRAGILPPDWNLAVHGISLDHLPPGVPCLVHAAAF